jgi:hypothetical protein
MRPILKRRLNIGSLPHFLELFRLNLRGVAPADGVLDAFGITICNEAVLAPAVGAGWVSVDDRSSTVEAKLAHRPSVFAVFD